MVVLDLSLWGMFFLALPLLGWPGLEPRRTKQETKLLLVREKKEKQVREQAEKRVTGMLLKLEKKYGNTKPIFTVSCTVPQCGQSAAIVTFCVKERKIIVSGTVHYTFAFGDKTPMVSTGDVVRDVVFGEAFSLAEAGNFKKLDIFLKNLNQRDRAPLVDGLKNFCHECDGAYCERHHNSFSVEDDGFYDYTRWVCLRGHEHGIDD